MLRGLRFWYRAVRVRPGTTESLPKPTASPSPFGVLAIPIVVAVAALVPACASSEGSEIGSCPIRPGADCAGNYMKGVHLEYSTLFDANLDHADLTGASLASVESRGRDDPRGATGRGPLSPTRSSVTPT